MNDLNIQYKRLVESLKLLSSSYSQQKNYFPDFVDLPFELSDTYHNNFLLLPRLIQNSFFTYEIIANLMRLENMLNSIMCNPLFDDIDEKVFLENEEWDKIRKFSTDILCQIGESVTSPDSKYI